MTNSIPHTGLGLEGCGLGLGLALGMCLWPWLSNNDIADDLEKPVIAPNYPNKKPKTCDVTCSPRLPTLLHSGMDLHVWSRM